jgi:hypothetical protein
VPVLIGTLIAVHAISASWQAKNIKSRVITMKKNMNANAKRSTVKAPEEWTTGDEPMTGAQDSYLHTLAREAGKTIEEDLTKAEASEKIEELQRETGRRLKRKKSPQRKV